MFFRNFGCTQKVGGSLNASLHVRSAQCKGMEEATQSRFPCVLCKEMKSLIDFSPVAIKQWLKKVHHEEVWRCYDCQYPECHECSARPAHATPHNAVVDGRYYCETCRYPSCKQVIDGKPCGNRQENPGGKHRLKDSSLTVWLCHQIRLIEL